MTYLEASDDPDAAILKQLAVSGYNLQHKTRYFNTPLLIACKNPNVNAEVLQLLFEGGADPNDKNGYSFNALNFVAGNINLLKKSTGLAAAECLVKHGVDVNWADLHGSTPLLNSSHKFDKFPELAEKLL
jgi:ankyrin repeat protein